MHLALSHRILYTGNNNKYCIIIGIYRGNDNRRVPFCIWHITFFFHIIVLLSTNLLMEL